MHLRKCLDGSAGEDTAREVANQVAFADVILLNKIDLVSAAALDEAEAAVHDINAVARVIHTRLDTDNCPQWLSRVRRFASRR